MQHIRMRVNDKQMQLLKQAGWASSIKMSIKVLQKGEDSIQLKLIKAQLNHPLFPFWRIPCNQLSRLQKLKGVIQAANEIFKVDTMFPGERLK